jgi:DNA polymerase III subunit beta
MKASFDREALLSAFQLVGSVVPPRTPKVILQNAKLTVTNERAVLMATDLEVVGIRLEVRGVKVAEPGEALLSTSRLMSILRETTDQEIQIEADANGCMVRGQYSEFELPGEDPQQYPDVPKFESENYHQVQANLLRDMIAKTVFATAQENARYALTGVLWELSPEKARLVATDGRRLAVADGIGIMHGKHATSGTPVVPTKAMTLLERNLNDPEEPVFVSIGANEVLFKTSRAVIYGRLVEGRYPPYKEVFPKKTTIKVKLKVGEFLSKVKQAAVLTDEESRGIDCAFAKGKITLKSRVPDKGRAKVEMPIDFDGKTVDITFDPRFVVDMLRVLDPESEATLELVDANSPALFKSGDDYSYIVMPLTRENR